MSNDYEYWVEQQQEFQQFAALGNYDPNCRNLGYWIDGIENQIWSWYPGHRAYGWMLKLHRDLKVGSQSFLAKNIYPTTEREDNLSSKQQPLRIVNGIIYEVTGREGDVRFDVLVLSQNDLSLLKRLSKRLASAAKDMKEECFAEMVEQMSLSVGEEKSLTTFVFHREI